MFLRFALYILYMWHMNGERFALCKADVSVIVQDPIIAVQYYTAHATRGYYTGENSHPEGGRVGRFERDVSPSKSV